MGRHGSEWEWESPSDARPQRSLVAIYCALGVLAFTGAARAQAAQQALPPPETPRATVSEAKPNEQFVSRKGTPKQPPTKHVRYGYQTLLVDMAALGVGLGARSFTAFSAVFVSGAPVIHFAHANLGPGLADLGIRAAAVIVGHAGFSCEDNPSPEADPSDDGSGACYGDTALGVLAMVSFPLIATFDALVLAKKPLRQTTATASTWSLTPVVSQRHGGMRLTGRF